MHRAYYNEHDKHAAQWLRNLISAGEIAPGDVDERSILDVRPDDLIGYTQCHFFAGVGTFSKALRDAGWPDSHPIWSGSCPCQPFSSAGRGDGFADERHLWPAFHHLIRERRPPVVIGEQVASKDGIAWLDLVQNDLEGEDYAAGALDFCAAGVGAPHIRQRIYWFGLDLHELADLHRSRRARLAGRIGEVGGDGRSAVGSLGHPYGERQGPIGGVQQRERAESFGGRVAGLLGDATGGDGGSRSLHSGSPGQRWGTAPDAGGQGLLGDAGRAGLPVRECGAGGGAGPAAVERRTVAESGGAPHLMADGASAGWSRGPVWAGETGEGPLESGRSRGPHLLADAGHGFVSVAEWGQEGRDGLGPDSPNDPARAGRPGPVNGYWRGADWLFCRDGKWRPVIAGSQPLVDGTAFKLGSGSPWEGKSRSKMLKGYGNGIVLPQATEFVRALMETLDDA